MVLAFQTWGQVLGFRVQGLGLWGSGFSFGVQVLGFRVQVLGFRVLG